ncbi:MAG: ABC transporter ATP-binding protein [Candidatus Aminicenantes bacterium]|jgi:ABC-type lipoprotein export system ATPase subunit|nr:ABC transporter ATP-binding protein [Candidatus Aminicenantes bacterium]
MSNLLRASNLGKEYPMPKGVLRIFSGLHFELEAGDIAAVMGASGVGKTTLLNLLGALDRPTEGTVYLDGEDLFARDEMELARIRNRKIGFVFQFFHLLPEFTALENVSLPLMISGLDRLEALKKGLDILREVFLEDKAHCRPAQLSAGEQQRVAIARALINEPKLLLADEPTGNLDWKTGELILRLLLDLHKRKGLSSILVTHNDKVAQFCRKLYVMERGELKLLA